MALRWFVHSACHVLGYEPTGNGGGDVIRSSNLSTFNNGMAEKHEVSSSTTSGFQMPLHYPRYTKADYEKMEEWKVDMVLREYGWSYEGSLDEKRAFAMGAFLWPDQY